MAALEERSFAARFKEAHVLFFDAKLPPLELEPQFRREARRYINTDSNWRLLREKLDGGGKSILVEEVKAVDGQ